MQATLKAEKHPQIQLLEHSQIRRDERSQVTPPPERSTRRASGNICRTEGPTCERHLSPYFRAVRGYCEFPI